MRVFEEVHLVRFVVDALAMARRNEAEALGQASLYALVESALADGRAFGLTSTDDLLRWSLVTLQLGVGFQSDPACAWVHELLDDWDPDHGARVVRLEHALRARERPSELPAE